MPSPSSTRNAICLCADQKMMIPAMSVANSVLEMSKGSDTPFDIILFAEEAEVTDSQCDWMRTKGIGLRTDIDLSAYRRLYEPGTRITVATLTRMFLPALLENDYDRILYLDADLTIHGDASRLFGLDLGDHALAAVRSGMNLGSSETKIAETEAQFARLGMTKPYRFFNAGMLLIDIRKWIDSAITERTMEFVRTSSHLCRLINEESMNATIDGDFCAISSLWNMPAHKTPEDYRVDGPGFPVIVHHMGMAKPWRPFIRHRHIRVGLYYYGLYRSFLRGTPWEDWLGQQWAWGDLGRNLEWELVEALRRVTRRAERRAYAKARVRYWREAIFADVEQGLVIRENGVLRLA